MLISGTVFWPIDFVSKGLDDGIPLLSFPSLTFPSLLRHSIPRHLRLQHLSTQIKNFHRPCPLLIFQRRQPTSDLYHQFLRRLLYFKETGCESNCDARMHYPTQPASITLKLPTAILPISLMASLNRRSLVYIRHRERRCHARTLKKPFSALMVRRWKL